MPGTAYAEATINIHNFPFYVIPKTRLFFKAFGCFLRIWRMAMVTGYGVSSVLPGYDVSGYGVSSVLPGYGDRLFQHPHYLAAVFVKHIFCHATGCGVAIVRRFAIAISSSLRSAVVLWCFVDELSLFRQRMSGSGIL